MRKPVAGTSTTEIEETATAFTDSLSCRHPPWPASDPDDKRQIRQPNTPGSGFDKVRKGKICNSRPSGVARSTTIPRDQRRLVNSRRTNSFFSRCQNPTPNFQTERPSRRLAGRHKIEPKEPRKSPLITTITTVTTIETTLFDSLFPTFFLLLKFRLKSTAIAFDVGKPGEQLAPHFPNRSSHNHKFESHATTLTAVPN